MPGKATFHRWRHAQAFVDAHPIVMCDHQGDRGLVMGEFLAVGERAPRMAPQLGRVHTFERFNDECEADEEGEHHIQLVEPRKDAAESLQSAKEPLHFIAFLILLSVVRPRFTAIALGRHDRRRS